jgi:hypothetical protein
MKTTGYLTKAWRTKTLLASVLLYLKNTAGILVAVVCINYRWLPKLGFRTGQDPANGNAVMI